MHASVTLSLKYSIIYTNINYVRVNLSVWSYGMKCQNPDRLLLSLADLEVFQYENDFFDVKSQSQREEDEEKTIHDISSRWKVCKYRVQKHLL